MISLVVTYCLVLNQYVCRTLEMVPDDGHRVASQMECIKGGAIGSMSLDMTFTIEHAEWRTRGYRCIEKPTVMQTWLRERR